MHDSVNCSYGAKFTITVVVYTNKSYNDILLYIAISKNCFPINENKYFQHYQIFVNFHALIQLNTHFKAFTYNSTTTKPAGQGVLQCSPFTRRAYTHLYIVGIFCKTARTGRLLKKKSNLHIICFLNPPRNMSLSQNYILIFKKLFTKYRKTK